MDSLKLNRDLISEMAKAIETGLVSHGDGLFSVSPAAINETRTMMGLTLNPVADEQPHGDK